MVNNKNFIVKLKFLVRELTKKAYKGFGREIKDLQILNTINGANGVEAIIDYIDNYCKCDYEKMTKEGAGLTEELLGRVPEKFYKKIFGESCGRSPKIIDVFRFWYQVLLLRKLKNLGKSFRNSYLEKEDLGKINARTDDKIKKLLVIDCKVIKKLSKMFNH